MPTENIAYARKAPSYGFKDEWSVSLYRDKACSSETLITALEPWDTVGGIFTYDDVVYEVVWVMDVDLTEEQQASRDAKFRPTSQEDLDWLRFAESKLPELTERVATLGTVMYQGSGFHYEKERSLSRMKRKIEKVLELGLKPNWSWTSILRVAFEALIDDLDKAERSVEAGLIKVWSERFIPEYVFDREEFEKRLEGFIAISKDRPDFDEVEVKATLATLPVQKILGQRFAENGDHFWLNGLGGHFGYSDMNERKRLFDSSRNCPFGFFAIGWEPETMVAMYETLVTGEPTAEWYEVRFSKDCYCCGEKVVLETNGFELRAKNACEYPGGVPPFSTELNIPSGKMVVANDLRDLFPGMDPDLYVNYTVNLMRTTQAYETEMAHGFCGNSCPVFYKRTNGEFYLTCNDGEEGDKAVASISTSLWWYSIADHERCLLKGLTDDYEEFTIVPCRPGKYRVTHYGHMPDRDTRPYARFEWIGEAGS